MVRGFTTWEAFENSCPRIDWMALKHYEINNRLTLAERKAACSLQEHTKQKWSLSKITISEPDSGHESRNMSEQIRWYNDNLRWNSVNSHFEFEDPQSSQPTHQPFDDFRRSIRLRGLYNHISCSLLLYCLNILAGEIKDLGSGHYKNSWDLTFHHLDGASILRLWDSKGGARALFSGLKQAEADALEFINFVTRFKFHHSYDGVISGTVA
jgi:hypothetical protein